VHPQAGCFLRVTVEKPQLAATETEEQEVASAVQAMQLGDEAEDIITNVAADETVAETAPFTVEEDEEEQDDASMVTPTNETFDLSKMSFGTPGNEEMDRKRRISMAAGGALVSVQPSPAEDQQQGQDTMQFPPTQTDYAAQRLVMPGDTLVLPAFTAAAATGQEEDEKPAEEEEEEEEEADGGGGDANVQEGIRILTELHQAGLLLALGNRKESNEAIFKKYAEYGLPAPKLKLLPYVRGVKRSNGKFKAEPINTPTFLNQRGWTLKPKSYHKKYDETGKSKEEEKKARCHAISAAVLEHACKQLKDGSLSFSFDNGYKKTS